MRSFRTLIPVVCLVVAGGCRSGSEEPAPGQPRAPSSDLSLVGTAKAAVAPPPAAALDPARGTEIGMVFEAFLSPHQEPGEEDATPRGTPEAFRSTTPSKSRNEREAAGHRGHGQVRFSRDLSRAFVDVRIEGVELTTINMFHIHCGQPGILGPILVDFALATDLQENFGSGTFSVEVTNADLVNTSQHGHGAIAAFTAGCVVPGPSLSPTPTKVSTVAGMAHIAQQGELYFNLHTTGQTYYGDIRGQIHAVP